MIRYEDIIRKIHLLENQKIKNEERIKKYSEENILIANKLKLLNQKKEMMEKMESDLSDILSSQKITRRQRKMKIEITISDIRTSSSHDRLDFYLEQLENEDSKNDHQ